MKTKHFVWIGVAIACAAASGYRPAAQAQDILAAYERADSLNRRVQGLVYNQADAPNFTPNGNAFSYRKSVKGGNEFVFVDPVARTKGPAFDHARLAAAINAVANEQYTAVTLPFSAFNYLDNRQAIEFTIGGGGGRQGGGGGGRQGGGPTVLAPGQPRWRCALTSYTCTRTAAPEGPGREGGQGRGGQGRGGGIGSTINAIPEPDVRVSPDRRWEALIQNHNVYVRPARPAAGAAGGGRAGGRGAAAGQAPGQAAEGFLLSTDGSEGNAYTFQSLAWAPDSKKLTAFRRRPGYERLVHYVESSPRDQVQPKHFTLSYRKPGDVVDFDHPVVFDVESKRQMPGDAALFDNPFANTRLEWREDSSAVTFEYNQRGHQLYRVVEIDAATGRTRTVIEETSKTFVEYSGKRYRYDVANGREIIWASERDGWNHLYLYDGATGQVKNQITRGEWVVRGVDRVDEERRQIWFRASGMHAGKDPYYIHYFRINFDGSGLTAFTDADGTHTVTFSPDNEYYVDTWSRVDLPPQTVLKRTSDQSVVMELEKADITDLLATGWRLPEPFVSKARDGTTDIWGVIIRPTNFDPNRRYPVIENIYAGPQGSFVPKPFSTQTGMMSLAELGFVVVQIDGMGTSNRSKVFHDMAWQNIGDAGFPDRIIWHRAVAAKYSYYDLTRVGIYGTSAGGQNAAGAVLFHPDFYHVAYSNSGCHDNRMDKIWWNEQWMGWPIGPHYAASSNVDNAHRLKGRLMLLVPELDTNVDPASTTQVADALIRAGKTFEFVVVPGANHGAGGAFTIRKRNDWFVKNLLGVDPPNWNSVELPTSPGGLESDEPNYFELERAPFVDDMHDMR